MAKAGGLAGIIAENTGLFPSFTLLSMIFLESLNKDEWR
jgi:hypothetical protein